MRDARRDATVGRSVQVAERAPSLAIMTGARKVRYATSSLGEILLQSSVTDAAALQQVPLEEWPTTILRV